MTSSNPTPQSPAPARHSLAWSVLAAVVVAFLLIVALRAPEHAGIIELPRPVPRPALLDVPVMSPSPVRVTSPKH